MEYIPKVIRYRKSLFLWFIYIIIISTLYHILTEYSLWEYWGVQSYDIHFTDLHVLLCSIDAYHNGYNPFLENPTCTWNIPHVYSRLWFYFHYVGFSDANRLYIGFFLIVSVMGVAAFILQNNIRFSILFIVSPVFMLAIERCNNDLIILLLLIVPLLLVLKTNLISTLITHLFLFLLVALKYYPIACCIIFLFRKESIKKKIISCFITNGLFTFWIIYVKNDLILQKDTIPDPGYSWSFGFNSLISFFSNSLSINIEIPYFILILLTILYISFVTRLIGNSKLYTCNNKDFIKKYIITFIIGSSILCFCYFVRTSFDHRMVFLIFCIPLMLYNYTSKRKKIYLLINTKLLFTLFLISSWMEFFCIWIVKLMKSMDYHTYIPNTFFGKNYRAPLKPHHIFNLAALLIYLIIEMILKTNYYKK